MNRAETLPAVESIRISKTIEVVTADVSVHREIMVCSPRANVAYSFWQSWQWLKRVGRTLLSACMQRKK